jgi:hypothetical protein
MRGLSKEQVRKLYERLRMQARVILEKRHKSEYKYILNQLKNKELKRLAHG